MKKFLRLAIPLLVALFIAAPFILFGGDGVFGDAPTLTPPPDDATAAIGDADASPDIGDAFPAVPLRSAKDGELRAVWVSTIINLDYPSRTGLTANELKAEAVSILDGALAMGFNAIIFQVRPAGDAFYKSENYPWSEYLTGIQGQYPGFDPLEFWVTEAHARGLEIHAWVNPYRVSRGSHDIGALAPENPARQHPEWVVMHSDGNMYFDPGIPEVRALVADGVREIVDNYNIDGIHCDDYFYPDGGLDDAATYAASATTLALADWRRQNVDELVGELRDIAHSRDGVVFGISPFGIWANAASHPLGSATNGNQSYYSHFADTRGWVKSGLVDYICPQLYWNIGFAIADYSVLLDWWADVVRGTDVKLYIGHADYRTGAEDPTSVWFGTSEIRRQLDLNKTCSEVAGSFHFRYQFFVNYPALGAMITNYHITASLPDDYPLMGQVERDGSLAVGRPYEDITTDFAKYYVLGVCDPAQPLTLNGKPVEGVSESGFFGVMVDLKNGENVLEFRQNDTVYTRVITRGTSSAPPDTLSKAEIPPDSAYPSDADIYLAADEKITLRCIAPIGAEVRVTIAGDSFKLSPSTTKNPANDGAIYSTTYSYTYTIKDYADGTISSVGRPVYHMTYGGKSSSVQSNGTIRCIGDGAPFYAMVSGEAAFIYSNASTQGGNAGEIPRGMTDYITAITTNGRWIRLRSGYWVERGDVDRVHSTDALSAALTAATYTTGEREDVLTFDAGAAVLTTVTLDDNTLTLGIRYADAAPWFELPAGALVGGWSSYIEGGTAWYRLELANSAELGGYWLDATEDSISLVMRRKPTLAEGSKPLAGISITLDPGHGGSDNGAMGPLGVPMSERVLALAIAEKLRYELEALGASVFMTREGDTTIDLTDRVRYARRERSDLILSVHLNAVEVNVDASNIHGVSTWYRNDFSTPLNEHLAHSIAAATGLYDRGANQTNLYICRPTWCPSAIIETGFICCPRDYEWLISDARQAAFARATALAVVEWFK